MLGGRGNDSVWGANGNDFVSGGDGDDRVGGGDGDDRVYGGRGSLDVLSGGAGNDLFGFEATTTQITDVTLGQDKIDRNGHSFPASLNELMRLNSGNQFTVGGSTVQLPVAVSSLTSESFSPALPFYTPQLQVSDATVTEGGVLQFQVTQSTWSPTGPVSFSSPRLDSRF